MSESWWERGHHGEDGFLVAYFCCEFALDESLPIYAGGLGVLAGDHLKAADELGVPLVGIGLLYRRGYFRQRLDQAGQAEDYPELDPERLPLELVRDEGGAPVHVEVELADELVRLQVWRARAGAVPLLLLDSDVEGNSEAARSVTDVLYGGDREHRIRQEVVLGVGGVRALAALGYEPTVFHMNEGHSAFLVLERVRALVEGEGLPFAEARERVRESNVFTTHTPVPAGNELFDPELVRRYAGPLAERCGLGVDDLLALGRLRSDEHEFGLTPFALRLSARANGVSALHGEVSRTLWRGLDIERPEEEAPIGHVVNGVHPRTWVSEELRALLEAAGVRLGGAPEDQAWERAAALEPAELWRVHRRRKEALLEAVSAVAGVRLDPEALTIGFARRFATYKRAGLLFSDRERVAALLGDPERPVQVVLAGKAHPADGGGKELMRELVEYARGPAAGRVVFLAGYDLALARLLVQGADVWLNTPRRPLEASGTSGMKAGLNGVLNLSVLDGWWAEGYDPAIGWAIGSGDGTEVGGNGDDGADADALYCLLEEEVVPVYHERDEAGLPRRWLDLMTASIARVGAGFGAERMVAEYVERYYLEAHRAAAAVRVARR